jgi:hypothetical protein
MRDRPERKPVSPSPPVRPSEAEQKKLRDRLKKEKEERKAADEERAALKKLREAEV